MEDLPSITGVTSGAGDDIPVVNISRGGALLRTRWRFASGATIRLHIGIADDDISLSGFVLRSSVSTSKRPPRYDTAVLFSLALPVLDGGSEPLPSAPKTAVLQFPPLGTPSGDEKEFCQFESDADSAVIGAFLAIDFYNEQDTKPGEMLELNNW
jgi:hypothetical protein